MTTQRLSAQTPADIARAARLLRAGELVAIPTETVYGLAANALDPAAVRSIFAAKGRPQDNPLIVHVPDIGAAEPLAADMPAKARELAERFWPGPLTIILKKSERIPDVVSAGLGTVALRVPAHPAALGLLRVCGLPLAAPSANLSGSPSPTTAAHVLHDFDGKIAAALDGGPCRVGVESTVVTLAAPAPTLLRPGGVAPEALRAVLGELEISSAVARALRPDEPAASPGMKYKHYAPNAELILIRGSLPDFLGCAEERQADGILVFDGDMALCSPRFPRCLSYGREDCPEEQANQLFSRLREIDALGWKRVLVRRPAPDGVGLAVYNRLLRAAAFREVDLR
ncbi:MAG: threonylcarbamoyl-AMP synthase [Oscillospiraceae bacterium]|jgi:L-threonylcarbamoyladenylate synthase|nr:threonylcarbamoyl-AMP synthase [Oscillospiraceae bacterium]